MDGITTVSPWASRQGPSRGKGKKVRGSEEPVDTTEQPTASEQGVVHTHNAPQGVVQSEGVTTEVALPRVVQTAPGRGRHGKHKSAKGSNIFLSRTLGARAGSDEYGPEPVSWKFLRIPTTPCKIPRRVTPPDTHVLLQHTPVAPQIDAVPSLPCQDAPAALVPQPFPFGPRPPSSKHSDGIDAKPVYSHHLHPGRYGKAVLNNPITNPLPRILNVQRPASQGLSRSDSTRSLLTVSSHAATTPLVVNPTPVPSESPPPPAEGAPGRWQVLLPKGWTDVPPRDSLAIERAYCERKPMAQCWETGDLSWCKQSKATYRYTFDHNTATQVNLHSGNTRQLRRVAVEEMSSPMPEAPTAAVEDDGLTVSRAWVALMPPEPPHTPPWLSARGRAPRHPPLDPSLSNGARGVVTFRCKAVAPVAVLVLVVVSEVRRPNKPRQPVVRFADKEHSSSPPAATAPAAVAADGEERFTAQLQRIFAGLQQHWVKVSGDTSSAIDDVDPNDLLLPLKKEYLRKHPVSKVRMSRSCPEELKHAASTIAGPDGVKYIITVVNQDVEDDEALVKQQGTRPRRKGKWRGRRSSHTRRSSGADGPKSEQQQLQELAEKARILSSMSTVQSVSQDLASIKNDSAVKVNVLGGLTLLSESQEEKIQHLLERQKEAERHLAARGLLRNVPSPRGSTDNVPEALADT